MTTNKVHNLSLSALMLAVLIVCSQLTIPLPIVPITLQTLAVGIIATVLSPSYSVLVVSAYIILGAIGLPVFAGLSGGAPVLAGPTGGYIWGFIVYALITSLLLKVTDKSAFAVLLMNGIGAIVQLFLGTLWIQLFIHASILKAFSIGFFPFLIPLIIKVILVTAVYEGLKKAIVSFA
ncbi:biotin transporter BioY [Lacticaseibacillus paracasei]|uniref:biotin transporter BioY n=1 Tax=Lacticaseibacillus paracasei TaxID=1597 RepID=UPI0002973B57|nr:biotin transporter BioY [Lacticaseibacillus paracasei]EKP98176.1 biotin ECF transporter substrate-specific component [Lacticaseibacillus casei 12A]